MGGIEKFMFEVSFDEVDVTEEEAVDGSIAEDSEFEEPEEEIQTFTEDELDAARDESFEAGKDTGIREAADAIETKINDALGIISANIDDLFKRQTIGNAETFADAVNIAVAISRKCFPHLNEIHGLGEVEAMVREVLAEVLEEPRVLIHLNPEIKETLGLRIDEIAKDSNFEGQIILLEDEEMASGDCRINWSSGSAERDAASIWSRIDEIVEQNLGTVREEVVVQIEENGTATSDTDDQILVEGMKPSDGIEIDANASINESEGDLAAHEPPTPADQPVQNNIESGAAPGLEGTEALSTPSNGPEETLVTSDVESPSETLEAAETKGSVPAEAPTGEDVSENSDAPVSIDMGLPPEVAQAMTQAHLQAGPGSMAPDTNGGILNDEASLEDNSVDGPPVPPAQDSDSVSADDTDLTTGDDDARG